MTLDEMIADAKSRLDNASDENAKLQAAAEVDALTKAKEAGYTKTQDDLNAVDKQNKDALKEFRQEVERLTGPWDEFKQTLANVEQQIVPAGSEEDSSGESESSDDPALNRVFGELSKRDQAIQTEREARLNFERELRAERLTNSLNDQFRTLGLQDAYLPVARQLVPVDSLVEKAMSGEEVEEDLKTQAQRVKDLSGVWFEQPRKPGVPPPPPGVPRSPDGGQPRELTDEERAQRSESVI